MFEYPEEKKFAFFKFDDLRIYNKSLEFVAFLYENTDAFPDNLKTDFQDAANSIIIAIAQGSFMSTADFIDVLTDVKNAIRLCVVYTAIGHRIHAFNDEQENESKTHLMELSKMLHAFIGSLNKKVNNKASDDVSIDSCEMG